MELRDYQKTAINCVTKAINEMGFSNGRVVIPTGGGKTVIEAKAIAAAIENAGEQKKMFLVVAPRIDLANQLMHEYRNFIGSDYVALAFHSGKKVEQDWSKVQWEERNTVIVADVKDEYKRAQRLDKHLIVFTTYISARKLHKLDFDVVICDESQYCVAENYFDNIKSLKARAKLYFTATEKHSALGGRGLNNTETFGDILFTVAPAKLIAEGYIVAPRLHVMRSSTTSDDYDVVTEVINMANEQTKLNKLPVNKILFAMKGTEDVRQVADNFKRVMDAVPGHNVYTIVSDKKYSSMINGEKVERRTFYSRLREDKSALIFHYDIMSEGIDIDGITGVAILRNMSYCKTMQTIGRAVRLYKANPSLKTFAWVSVSVIDGNEESLSQVKNIINGIRLGGFDVNKEDITYSDIPGHGIMGNPELEDYVDINHKSETKATLDEFLHEIEEYEKIMEAMNNPEAAHKIFSAVFEIAA